MDELLQKLLEAEVLSADTKKELEEAMTGKIDEAVQAAKDIATADVRADLTEQWIQERDVLIEAIDTKVTDFLNVELEDLKSDIERFRDVEAEHAEKLIEAKTQMNDDMQANIVDLVEKMDAFLEIRLNAEMTDLKEELDEVRKLDFGRKMFEAFASEYASSYADDDSLEGTLRETKQRLEDSSLALEEAEAKLSEMARSQKMDEVLNPLDGRSKEVMEAILRNVPTEQLEEGYKTFIGRVLKETIETVDTSEKEELVLAEGTKVEKKEVETVVISGDTENLIETNDVLLSENDEKLNRLKHLAGI